ncbi:MAG: helix-hairpin-helix domain-containing protein, partial [Thauera sp.]|nr:helix-hairpin-helix domain-containing protein [Thauera sp.]
GQVHPSLHNPVRLRIEGERSGLPGPAVTPYLVGLLVLLGMLGTFLGMVVTLNGAVLALESTTDLHTIRAALAAANKATLPVVYISEAGAYAASRAELEELPEADADLRAAVYLGRRLQDPLAELVKLDPRSVLGGMYPQDVDRNDLRKRIEQTFASCVARVGVDVNGADAGLLRFVPGVDAKLAKTIVERRQAQGRIPSRAELLSI